MFICHEHGTKKNLFITHDTFNISDPSSLQDASHMNLVKWRSSPRVSRSSVVRVPTGILEAIGLTHIRDSEFFLCATLMTNEHYVFIIMGILTVSAQNCPIIPLLVWNKVEQRKNQPNC